MDYEENIIAAVDIGSSKTSALIARVNQPEEIELIGLGVALSRGVKAGSVTNIEQTMRSIREAMDEAELMSGVEVSEVVMNISGKHVHGDNSSGVIAITNKSRMIGSDDIYRVIDAAKAIRIPADQKILHVLSREFKVDDQNAIKDPTGMVGVRLEADVHIVTAASTHLQNTERAVHESGLKVFDSVLSALASSQALLSEGERDLGVAVVDIGAGVIDIIIYLEGGVAYTSTVNIGAQHITQDISIGLKTPMDAAEALKKRYGCVMAEDVDPMETIEVPSVGGRTPRTIARRELADIMEARMREILEFVDQELMKSGCKHMLAGGVILTGGGSLGESVVKLAEEIIQLGASVGYPKGLLGIADKICYPMFSTVVGLVQYSSRYGDIVNKKKKKRNFWGKAKSWIQENL